MAISVVIADDDAAARRGLNMILKGAPDIQIVGEAVNGEAAVELVRTKRPDVVLMDVKMPRMDGVTATRLLTRLTNDHDEQEDHLTKVLLMTSWELNDALYDALGAGASGFILKESTNELIAALRAVADGEHWLEPTVGGRIFDILRAREPLGTDSSEVPQEVTRREREVLVAVGRGLSNPEIAREFGISEPTVKTHVSRLLFKTGTRDRPQLIVFAYRSGVVKP